MVRASQSSRICTHKPDFDVNVYETKQAELATKVKAKLDEDYHIGKIKTYIETPGLKTVGKEFSALMKKKFQYENDPLPSGAKSYLQEVWLEQNYNFHSFSLKETDFALMKGKLVESSAISLLSEYYDISISKNINRITKDFLTGECDVIYGNTIRDMKCPQDWKTFRKKFSIEIVYYWQLISYCYLYGGEQAFLDYMLMNIPADLISVYTRGFTDVEFEKFLMSEKQIANLPTNQRIKSFKLEADIQAEINFLVSRVEKSKVYYESLTYEKCMKMDRYAN